MECVGKTWNAAAVVDNADVVYETLIYRSYFERSIEHKVSSNAMPDAECRLLRVVMAETLLRADMRLPYGKSSLRAQFHRDSWVSC